MKMKFVAKDLVIVPASSEPDYRGDIYTAETEFEFKDATPVVLEQASDSVIGYAKLSPAQRGLVGDIQLGLLWLKPEQMLLALRHLKVGASGRIVKRDGAKVLHVVVELVVLTETHPDPRFLPLGDKLQRVVDLEMN